MFDHIIGNEKVKKYLKCTAERKLVGNSLLFAGPSGVGKSLFAEAFAKLLICDDPSQKCTEGYNHPDIHIYRPEGKIGMHSIASMRQFSEEVYIAPSQSKWKIFIIQEADRMLPYSANALLKTFEEPSSDTLIILISSAPNALLPTVLSRCRRIYFQPLTKNELASLLIRFGRNIDEANEITSLANGSMEQAMKFVTGKGNILRKVLLDELAIGRMPNYKYLSTTASKIAEDLEVSKKTIEAELRDLYSNEKDLSVFQKQLIEKEIEGAVALHTNQAMQMLLSIIQGWYRDLHLLSVNGNPTYLTHPDYHAASSQAVERGQILPLEAVQCAISEIQLALERSTSLQICFENLFLKLNLLK